MVAMHEAGGVLGGPAWAACQDPACAGGVLGSCGRRMCLLRLPRVMGYSLQTVVFLHSRAKSYILYISMDG